MRSLISLLFQLQNQKVTISTHITLGCPDYVPYHPLSHGWWFVIGVCTLTFLYLVTGIIYNRRANGAQGVESIPNWEAWRGLPSLVADGVGFFSDQVGQAWDKWRGKDAYQSIPDHA